MKIYEVNNACDQCMTDIGQYIMNMEVMDFMIGCGCVALLVGIWIVALAHERGAYDE